MRVKSVFYVGNIDTSKLDLYLKCSNDIKSCYSLALSTDSCIEIVLLISIQLNINQNEFIQKLLELKNVSKIWINTQLQGTKLFNLFGNDDRLRKVNISECEQQTLISVAFSCVATNINEQLPNNSLDRAALLICFIRLKDNVERLRQHIQFSHDDAYIPRPKPEFEKDGPHHRKVIITESPQIMLDRGFQRELLDLIVICKEKDNGCDWDGTLKYYQDHLDNKHTTIHNCKHCNDNFSSKDELDDHQKSLCTKIMILCQLAEHGCSKERFLRSDLCAHYLTELHQTCLQSVLVKIIQLIQSRYNGTDMAVMNSTSDPFNLISLMSTADTTSLSTNSVINYFYSQLQQLYETLTTVTKNFQPLNEDSIRLSTESLRQQNLLQACQNEINLIKQSKVEIDSYIAGIGPNQEILQQELDSVKQKVEDLQCISYDGTFTWKISNISEKITDAQSERQTSIYSPAFYSSPTGYKMCIRLYLQGDGNARRTHMSLFFLIMRGPFDAILNWPFSFKVTFCLYDQSGQQRHIIDSFRPDTTSNSFQRPRSEMNIASGIPKFFPLPMILQEDTNYIKDDTMYIKCLVDFGDISKIILPYALSLNPALPHHVQRHMIRVETDRRLQLQQ
ncbi:unnamed protein product [Didymodactylos carnosus]|uniref:MATH domain-containing protein n=1 Tax=Didymodactylos carnosus TaxID=1234261 RepID=A0A814VDI1_9BILA|nr:unnamed protein product [Didymodactylos carnosus]CAF3953406.1 unnamed protein product [Didymodactylos carnosus]